MENKVLASVNGKQITQEDVENFIAGMGQQGQAYRNPQGYEAVLEQLINQNLLLLDEKTINNFSPIIFYHNISFSKNTPHYKNVENSK